MPPKTNPINRSIGKIENIVTPPDTNSLVIGENVVVKGDETTDFEEFPGIA